MSAKMWPIKGKKKIESSYSLWEVAGRCHYGCLINISPSGFAILVSTQCTQSNLYICIFITQLSQSVRLAPNFAKIYIKLKYIRFHIAHR